jgi:hypothetical protein
VEGKNVTIRVDFNLAPLPISSKSIEYTVEK